MIVGSARIEIHFPHSHSLKDKRQVLRSVKERLRARLNVSVAEVEHQDLWQRASLGVATVAESPGFAERVLDEAVRLVESEPRLQILDVQRQLA